VLGDHVINDALVVCVDPSSSQLRPQIVILGAVVELQLSSEDLLAAA
jgi:hypothetical protein